MAYVVVGLIIIGTAFIFSLRLLVTGYNYYRPIVLEENADLETKKLWRSLIVQPTDDQGGFEYNPNRKGILEQVITSWLFVSSLSFIFVVTTLVIMIALQLNILLLVLVVTCSTLVGLYYASIKRNQLIRHKFLIKNEDK